MRPVKPTTYQTIEEIAAIVQLREAEADLLPAGPDKQSVLIEIARLRAAADAKCRLASFRHPATRDAPEVGDTREQDGGNAF